MTDLDFLEFVDRFDEILDAVERGEAFRVIREGRPVALLGPHAALNVGQIDIGSQPA